MDDMCILEVFESWELVFLRFFLSSLALKTDSLGASPRQRNSYE
jgi:hypothetical protein